MKSYSMLPRINLSFRFGMMVLVLISNSFARADVFWEFQLGGMLQKTTTETKYPEDYALQKLRYYRPNNQICLRNQELADKYLKFISAEEL